MSKLVLLLLVVVCAFSAIGQSSGPEITQGSLYAYDKKGKELGDCPLKNTAVKTDIAGFVARVHVTQNFENSFPFPIEAVYTFPLSQNGAVDDMTMTVGSRVIRAKIMKRDEARQTYEQAKSEGKTASLLDQERP
ncbi:MAG TPA: VIT domain-containing protein, partial [Pyrinomonadaceae bacterium]|nr:VIT domain-containing protein [Pyrinomonadaceae bacterium]